MRHQALRLRGRPAAAVAGSSPRRRRRAVLLAGGVLCASVLAGAAAAAAGRQAKLADFRRQHAGVRYSFGACNARSMDCSCFIQRLYRDAFGLTLPRTTLGQAAALTAARVPGIRGPAELRAPALCVGDLVYTYQGSSWTAGPRHVAVYAGNGELLHAWRGGGRVGTSPLAWARQFSLHGVYRPLGCGDSARGERPALRASAYDAGDDAAVRALIERFFASWRSGSTEALTSTFWPDGVQLAREGPRRLDAIAAARRAALREVRRAGAHYRIEALSFWGDLAIAEVRYDLELIYGRHRRLHDGIRETLILARRDGRWRISQQESLFGD